MTPLPIPPLSPLRISTAGSGIEVPVLKLRLDRVSHASLKYFVTYDLDTLVEAEAGSSEPQCKRRLAV